MKRRRAFALGKSKMKCARPLCLVVVLGCGNPTDGAPSAARPTASASGLSSATPPGRLVIRIEPAHPASKLTSGRVHVADRSATWSGAAVTFDGLPKGSHEVRVDGGLFADPIRVDLDPNVATEVKLQALAASAAGPPAGYVIDVNTAGSIAFGTKPEFSVAGLGRPEEAVDLSRVHPDGIVWAIRLQQGTSMKHVLPVMGAFATRASDSFKVEIEQPWVPAPEAEAKRVLAAGGAVAAKDLAACDGLPPEGAAHDRYRPCSAELRGALWLRYASERVSSDAKEAQRAFYIASALDPKIKVGDDAIQPVKDAYAAAKKQRPVMVGFSLASATAEHVGGGAPYEKYTGAIRDIVRAEEPAIRYCYASTLAAEPPKKTTAALTFYLRADGTPYWVAAEARPKNNALVACLQRVGIGLAFAAGPRDEQSMISLDLSGG